jgi:hypothetical protein
MDFARMKSTSNYSSQALPTLSVKPSEGLAMQGAARASWLSELWRS